MEFFNRLGNLIDQRWKIKNFDDEQFPEVAFQALSELPPSKYVGIDQLATWAVRTSNLPQQINYEFSQAALIVYYCSRFYIEALHWMEGITSLHQHAFCGAFHVLAGSSIHSAYNFHLKERINSRFLIGNVELRECEYLKQGDSRKIFPGNRYIHSIFHLDSPSMTIVVRTHSNPEAFPQYDYRKPYIAIDQAAEDLALKRKLQVLDVMRSMKHSRFLPLCKHLLSKADVETIYTVLEHFYWRLPQHQFGRLCNFTPRTYAPQVDLMVEALREEARVRSIVQKRAAVTDQEQRFFLALLMNLPDRKRILDFIRCRYPGDPQKKIMQWMKEMTHNGSLGIDFDDVSLHVFQCMVKGKECDEIQVELKKKFAPNRVNSSSKELNVLYDVFQSSIFKPLFL